MSQGPENTPEYNPYEPPREGQPAPGPQPYGQQPPPPTQPYGMPYADPAAPYGVHPVTGVPYSDKSKIVAGLLQVLIPLGIGRFYLNDTKTGMWQLIVTLITCGIGGLWPFIDGIIILATDSKDLQGRPLRS